MKGVSAQLLPKGKSKLKRRWLRQACSGKTTTQERSSDRRNRASTATTMRGQVSSGVANPLTRWWVVAEEALLQTSQPFRPLHGTRAVRRTLILLTTILCLSRAESATRRRDSPHGARLLMNSSQSKIHCSLDGLLLMQKSTTVEHPRPWGWREY